MSNVIVVFSKREVATNIRNILVRSGIDVIGICITGAQALHYVNTLDDGMIICGYRLSDMPYTELRQLLPDTFEMLLIASQEKWSDDLLDGVVGLSMPVKVYDLVTTVESVLQTLQSRRKKRRQTVRRRTPEERALISQAKMLLMERNGITEEEAHRYLQKSSMESGTNMLETAQMVLTMMNE